MPGHIIDPCIPPLLEFVSPKLHNACKALLKLTVIIRGSYSTGLVWPNLYSLLYLKLGCDLFSTVFLSLEKELR